MQTSAGNPNAPRPPMVAELLAIPDPEEEETPPLMFVPDLELGAWVEANLFGSDSPLLIEEHVHIMGATIGFVWTNVVLRKGGKQVGGTAQLGRPNPHMGDAWIRGEIENQRKAWFGEVPDLLVTLYAPACARCEGFQIVGLIDHELCHFAVETDKDDEPKYDEETGRLKYKTVGHDVEEFVGVVHRWGHRRSEHRALYDAGRHKPYLDRELANRLVGPPLIRNDSWQP